MFLSTVFIRDRGRGREEEKRMTEEGKLSKEGREMAGLRKIVNESRFGVLKEEQKW